MKLQDILPENEIAASVRPMVQIAREIFKTLLAPSLSVRNPDKKEPKIAMIADVTPIPHNGPRPKKRRRV